MFEMTSSELLTDCGVFQQKMFFRHFMSTGRVGEIMCSQINDDGDRIFFERFLVADTSFVVSFRVMMEDSMIIAGIQYSYKKIEDFVSLRENENRQRFVDRKKPDEVYEEFTRAMVEERLSPGKMTINGDRNSQIRVLYRQTEIPNDAQQARLNEYVLVKPLEVLELEQYVELFQSETITEADFLLKLADWKRINLEVDMQLVHPDLGTTVPFLRGCHRVTPRIYEWPREIDVEREAGLK